jgi:predicted ribosome quality control (RQC) complex YloA/Tae2 family protein
MERWAAFTFDCTDEMGFPVRKTLVAELMGRTCNLYLVNPEGRILDCLRRIGLDESAKRAALPGLNYQQPEPITKINPRFCHSEGAKRFEESSHPDDNGYQDPSTRLRLAQDDTTFSLFI